MTSQPRTPDRVLLAAWALFALGFLWTVAHWDHQHDEAITFDFALGAPDTSEVWGEPRPVEEWTGELERGRLLSPTQVVGSLWSGGTGQPHPPLYYLGLNLWAHVAGTGTWALRLPAFGLGLATLWLLAQLGRALWPGGRVGSLAALLMACSP